MAITNMQVVTGYYDGLGTPAIETVVSGHLSAGWIPHGAPVLTDVYGQVAQSMVKSTDLLTTAYTVVTGATPMAPDTTWDAMGNPTWIESGRYLQAYTKGDQVSANIDLQAQVSGVLPVVNGGTGADNPNDAWLNIRPTGSTRLSADPVNPLDATTKQWVEASIDTGESNAVASVLNKLAAGDEGDALVAVNQPSGSSVVRNQHAKNDECISVKDFGAVGDDVADDTAAIQTALNWMAAASNRTLYVPAGVYRVSSVTQTFVNTAPNFTTINCRLVCDGAFRHIQTTGNMFKILGAAYSSYEFNIVGTGYNSATIPNYTLADPVGVQQAVVFGGNRACKMKIRAVGYPGRVFRTLQEGSVKQSFIDLDITTGNDSCGQAMYLQGTDAWGCVSFAQTNWDYYGSVLDTITDMSVVYWEAGCKNRTAPVINMENIVNSHFTTIAAGGAKMRVAGGSGITIQKALLGESLDHALDIIGTGVGQPKHQITIHSLLAANTTGAGVNLSNVVGAYFKDYIVDGANCAFQFNNLCRDIQIDGESRNSATAGYLALTGSTLENVTIHGKCYSAGNVACCDFSQATTINVSLVDTTFVTQGAYLLTNGTSNGVNVRGGSWSGTLLNMTSAINYSPRSIKDVTGVNTRRTARAVSIPSGSGSGTTVSLAHGLYRAPNEVFVTVTDFNNSVSQGSNTVLVRAIDDTNITFKYSGTSSLSSALSFNVTAKCEDRSN